MVETAALDTGGDAARRFHELIEELVRGYPTKGDMISSRDVRFLAGKLLLLQHESASATNTGEEKFAACLFVLFVQEFLVHKQRNILGFEVDQLYSKLQSLLSESTDITHVTFSEAVAAVDTRGTSIELLQNASFANMLWHGGDLDGMSDAFSQDLSSVCSSSTESRSRDWARVEDPPPRGSFGWIVRVMQGILGGSRSIAHEPLAVTSATLHDKASLRLEQRAIITSGVLTIGYVVLNAIYIYALHEFDTEISTVSRSHTSSELSDGFERFVITVLPDFFVMLAINCFLAAVHPRDLASQETRKHLVPLCVIGIICDIFAARESYLAFRGSYNTANVSTRWRLHMAYSFHLLAIEDGYMVFYTYVLQRFTSWAWYRFCLLESGISCLVIILLLRSLGEEHYPPCGLGFSASLTRPAILIVSSAVFTPSFREYLHDLIGRAGFRHVPLDLKELRRDELHSYTTQHGGRPTASGNERSAMKED